MFNIFNKSLIYIKDLYSWYLDYYYQYVYNNVFNNGRK